MIPAHLAKLIHEGKAAYRTFMAGASQKSVLTVPGDRYFVIIGFTHFSYIPQLDTNDADLILQFQVTQMRISSRKSNNVFVIRNNINFVEVTGPTFMASIGEPYQENDLYLTHEEDISIAFSLGTDLAVFAPAPTPAASFSQQQPLGYGQEGNHNPPLPVAQNVISAVGEIKPQGHYTPATVANSSDQVEFPIVAGITDLPFFGRTYGTPLCLIKYVEIFGNPTNKQPSN